MTRTHRAVTCRACWRDWWRYGGPSIRIRILGHTIPLLPRSPYAWWTWRTATTIPHDPVPVAHHLWSIRSGITATVAPQRWTCTDRSRIGRFRAVTCTVCGPLTPEPVDTDHNDGTP